MAKMVNPETVKIGDIVYASYSVTNPAKVTAVRKEYCPENKFDIIYITVKFLNGDIEVDMAECYYDYRALIKAKQRELKNLKDRIECLQ